MREYFLSHFRRGKCYSNTKTKKITKKDNYRSTLLKNMGTHILNKIYWKNTVSRTQVLKKEENYSRSGFKVMHSRLVQAPQQRAGCYLWVFSHFSRRQVEVRPLLLPEALLSVLGRRVGVLPSLCYGSSPSICSHGFASLFSYPDLGEPAVLTISFSACRNSSSQQWWTR